MLRFRQMKTLQKFIAVHAAFHNHFNQDRHLISRETYRAHRSAALAEWQTLAAYDSCRLPYPRQMETQVRVGLTAPANGLAPGADLLAFHAALALGWKVHVFLPFPHDRCGPDDLASPAMLARATSVEVVEASEEAYAAMADRLLQGAGVLVAVHYGRGTAGPGGAADVIRRARARRLPVVEIRV